MLRGNTGPVASTIVTSGQWQAAKNGMNKHGFSASQGGIITTIGLLDCLHEL
jgi:hypothetical protein